MITKKEHEEVLLALEELVLQRLKKRLKRERDNFSPDNWASLEDLKEEVLFLYGEHIP